MDTDKEKISEDFLQKGTKETKKRVYRRKWRRTSKRQHPISREKDLTTDGNRCTSISKLQGLTSKLQRNTKMN
jgi:hypothetical protein